MRGSRNDILKSVYVCIIVSAWIKPLFRSNVEYSLQSLYFWQKSCSLRLKLNDWDTICSARYRNLFPWKKKLLFHVWFDVVLFDKENQQKSRVQWTSALFRPPRFQLPATSFRLNKFKYVRHGRMYRMKWIRPNYLQTVPASINSADSRSP